jgi:hypothetical protein
MGIDITKYSFDEWVRFIFDCSVTDHNRTWREELALSGYGDSSDGEYFVGNQVVLLEYLSRLFRDPGFLLETYSPEQLEQAFWVIPGQLLCVAGFIGPLWEKEIPWPVRQECIESMGDLFERLFAINPLDTSCYMWWDHLAYGYGMRGGVPEDDDSAQVQQVMFDTLCRILKLGSIHCQKSALHGLGHLRHPDTGKAIDEFLETHLNMDDELKQYALACRSGAIQ